MKSIVGRGNSRRKGADVEVYLEFSRNMREACRAETERARWKVGGGEGSREPGHIRPW